MSSTAYAVPFAVYLAVSNPATYKATRGLFGNWVSSSEGIPSLAGLMLHGLVFILIVGFFMSVRRSTFSAGYGIQGPFWPSVDKGYAPCGRPAEEYQ